MSIILESLVEIKKLRKCANDIINNFDELHESTFMLIKFSALSQGLSIDEFLENQKELVRYCDEVIKKYDLP